MGLLVLLGLFAVLVVIGAPGGSWFQRQLFGAGARLQAAAPGGVLVVRQDVPRVYQAMTAPQSWASMIVSSQPLSSIS